MGGLHPATPTVVAPPGASRPQEPAYGSAAAQLYSKGDAAGLAALAKAARDPDERLALEWASLRSDAHLSVAALAAFAEAHPGWPGGGWIRRRREGQLLVNPEAPAKVAAYFASEPPAIKRGNDRRRAGGERDPGESDEGSDHSRVVAATAAISTFPRKRSSCEEIRRCAHQGRPQVSRRPSALYAESFASAPCARGRARWPRHLRPGAGPGSPKPGADR